MRFGSISELTFSGEGGAVERGEESGGRTIPEGGMFVGNVFEIVDIAAAWWSSSSSRDSTLKEAARRLKSMVVFLPKYHCELNPIEQCWGYSKKKYRDMPYTNKDSVMEKDVLDAIDSVPIESIPKYVGLLS